MSDEPGGSQCPSQTEATCPRGRARPNALQTPFEVLFYLAQACLAIAVALTLWSGWEFYRDVWRQRASLRA